MTISGIGQYQFMLPIGRYQFVRAIAHAVLLGAGMAPPIGYRAPPKPVTRARNPKAAAQAARRQARKITRRAGK